MAGDACKRNAMQKERHAKGTPGTENAMQKSSSGTEKRYETKIHYETKIKHDRDNETFMM